MLIGLAYLGLALIATALALLVFALGRNPPEDSPRYGSRGFKRIKAVASNGLFAVTEPFITWLAGFVAYVPMSETRRKIDLLLKQSGDFLGLSANEFVALTFVSALLLLGIGSLVVSLVDLPVVLIAFFVGLGIYVPYARVMAEMQTRFKAVNRALPSTIGIAALCMSAGLDFPGSLRQITENASNEEDPLIEELSWILRELSLGFSRKQALENFAFRLPTEAVQEFVAAVIQSEEKGNPLADVLKVQADVLRKRRSVRAEELAARASVLMLGPLTLIFISVVLILMGPFLVTEGLSGIL